MRQAARTARYDQALGLEAYSLRAVDRPFPSHFHDHYVIGVVERGTRTLTCGRQRQVIGPGDVLLPAGPRRQAGEGSEIVGEMALIGKACLHGGLCRGDTPFQQAPCLADPHRHQIAVGRDALGLGKGPDQGGFAQSRLKAELLQRDMPGIVAPDERTGPLHLHPAGRNRFHHPGVPRQQEAPGQQQRLLPPELRFLPQHRPVQGPEAACQFSVPNHGHGKAGHCPAAHDLLRQGQHGAAWDIQSPVVQRPVRLDAGMAVSRVEQQFRQEWERG